MSTNRRKLLALLAAGVGAAGCSRIPFFGGEEKRLPGERIPVLLLDEGLRPDPTLAGTPVVLPPATENPAWTQVGGNARHVVGHPALAARPRIAWRRDAGAGRSEVTWLLAPPVVAQGRVFVVDTALVVRAFRLADGRPLWERELPVEERLDRLTAGGLAFADGRLFATATSGEVFALSAADGAPVWKRALGVPVEAPPCVAEGRVYVVSADNRLSALDGPTGTPLWEHAGFAEQTGFLGGAAPAADRGLVVAAYSSGQVFALRAADGRELWSASVLRPRRTIAIGTIADITAAPVIEGDWVYVAGNGGETAAFDLASGARRWALPAGSRETPWIAGDWLYLLSGRDELACVRRTDGRVRWAVPIRRLAGDVSGGPWAGPVLAGGRLVVAGPRGTVLLVSATDGSPAGRLELGADVSLPPVVAQRTLLFLTDDGELVALR